MKFVVLPLLALLLFSCQHIEKAVHSVLSSESVKVVVDSEKTGDVSSRQGTLTFPAQNESKTSTSTRTQCMRGAEFAGLRADGRCEGPCKYVVVDSSTTSKEDDQIKRTMQISVFSDKELKNKIYLAKVETLGKTNDVATELCEAAFQAYPESLNGRTFNIRSRTE